MPPGSGPFVLIAAVSGRALAQAARRAGYRPLVADLFGDLDTSEAAFASERVEGSLATGLRRPLLRALERLAAGRAPIGLVYGSGFERRTSLLRHLSARFPLLGNAPEVVARMADSAAFAALCRSAGVPHPEIADTATPDGQWLEKRIGGAGGAHIRPARPGRALRPGHYLQRRVEGRPVSALFLADGRACQVLGFSEQWAAPLPGRPFRYGGAVRPAALDAGMAREMAEVVARLVAASSTFVVTAPPSPNPSPRKRGDGGKEGAAGRAPASPPPLAGKGCRGGGSPAAGGLIGLNSADFLIRADGFDLLEINPRPGATLDIFSDAEPPLFELHLQASRGRLLDSVAPGEGASAAALVYAPRACILPDGFPWPAWAADRQPPGVPVSADGPLCTVQARANDAAAARHLVERRIATMLELTGMGQ